MELLPENFLENLGREYESWHIVNQIINCVDFFHAHHRDQTQVEGDTGRVRGDPIWIIGSLHYQLV